MADDGDDVEAFVRSEWAGDKGGLLPFQLMCPFWGGGQERQMIHCD